MSTPIGVKAFYISVAIDFIHVVFLIYDELLYVILNILGSTEETHQGQQNLSMMY